MNRIYLLFFVMLLTISSIHAQTPLQFNNDIAKITDRLFSQGREWGLKFNDAFKDGNYSVLKPITIELFDFVNDKTIYLQNLKDVKNSKPLRMAMIDFLAFEKQMLLEGFRPFELFDATTPKDKIQAALTSLLNKSKDEDLYLKKLTAVQEQYATENDFTIESKQ